MSDKPTPESIVGAYLSACRPPADATTAQIAQVINAWNEIAAKLLPKDNSKP